MRKLTYAWELKLRAIKAASISQVASFLFSTNCTGADWYTPFSLVSCSKGTNQHSSAIHVWLPAIQFLVQELEAEGKIRIYTPEQVAEIIRPLKS